MYTKQHACHYKRQDTTSDNAFDFKEPLQVVDLEETDSDEHSRLKDRPPDDARVCGLGGCGGA